jgi:hypothetical protein
MISTPFVELLNQDGEANPFVGVQVRRQTGKEKLCPQTGPRVPDDGLSDGAQDGLLTVEVAGGGNYRANCYSLLRGTVCRGG